MKDLYKITDYITRIGKFRDYRGRIYTLRSYEYDVSKKILIVKLNHPGLSEFEYVEVEDLLKDYTTEKGELLQRWAIKYRHYELCDGKELMELQEIKRFDKKYEIGSIRWLPAGKVLEFIIYEILDREGESEAKYIMPEDLLKNYTKIDGSPLGVKL